MSIKTITAGAIGTAAALYTGVKLNGYLKEKAKMKSIHEKQRRHKEQIANERNKLIGEKKALRNGVPDTESMFDVITEVEAKRRCETISSIEYTLGIAAMESEYYEGYTIAKFKIAQPYDQLFIDMHIDIAYKIIFNGKPLEQKYYKKSRIYFPLDMQCAGNNTLEVFYKNKYSESGEGLIHYYDNNDRNSYVYSQFSPFSAHKCFPCFDQPGLKATFHLFMFCPNGWKAISTSSEELTQGGREDSTLTLINKHGIPSYIIDSYEQDPSFFMFRKTKLISTHVFSIISGPYHYFGYQKEGIPPVRVFARLSLSKYVEKYSQQLFKIISIGFDWFKDYFAKGYMFNKLDIIFCPDFQYKAMENAGAITFCEKYFMFYNKSTIEESSLLVFMIFDKLADMWIGNCASFRWWNSNWVNESITRYLSYCVIEKIPELKMKYLGWSLQALNNQRFAFKIDNSPAFSHPVETICRDTSEIIEDSITFDKCTQIMSQFAYIVGYDNFRDALREYLNSFEFCSSSSADLAAILQKKCNLSEEGSKINVGEWMDMWIKTPGINILTPKWTVENGVISEFIIHQDSSQTTTTLRAHKISVLLYYMEKEQVKVEEIEGVWVDRENDTVIKCIQGKPEPIAVLLNSNNNTYSLINLDKSSYYWFMKNINLIDNHLKLTLIFYSMYRMAVETYDPVELFNFMIEKCSEVKARETSIPEIIDYVKKLCCNTFPDIMFKDMSKKAIDLLFSLIESQENTEVKAKCHIYAYCIEAMLYLASTKDDIIKIDQLITKLTKEGKGEMEVPLKLIHENYIKLCSIPDYKINGNNAYEVVKKKIDDTEDSSDAIKLIHACTAALPDIKRKMETLEWYFKAEEKYTFEILEASMRSFRQRVQEDILFQIDKVIFERLHEVAKLERRKALLFLKYVYPHNSNTSWNLSNLNKYVSDKVVISYISKLKSKIERNELAKQKCKKKIDSNKSTK